MTVPDWLLTTDRVLADAIARRITPAEVLPTLGRLSQAMAAVAYRHGVGDMRDWADEVKKLVKAIREANGLRAKLKAIRAARKELAELTAPLKAEMDVFCEV